ncbi:MAG: membrane dipeptidase [Lysobacterales bacterium]|nr:MAG: membrane dipeptidase [Xanthomonadales bacterium]
MTDAVEQRARALLNDSLVWDNHACMPLRPGDASFFDQLDRARQSGVDVISLNIGFGPLSLQDHLGVLAWFRKWLGQRPERFLLARHPEDIDTARRQGRLAVIFDIEGMAPLDAGDHGLVAMFRELGVGWMLIAYNRNNAAGGGCMDEDPGLSAHGRRILAEMKRVGMIACCSHTGQRTALDVLEAADNPVIFSHSNANAVHQHVRNISDELIRACAATGGVVGINGLGDFLGPGEDYAEAIVRHVDHMVELVGSEHVGLALDYVYDQQEVADYVRTMHATFGEEQAAEFSGRFAPPETFVPIVTRLLGLGYAERDIRNIVGGNWYRVASQVWR